MRAYGARVRSAVPVYGGANIVYWIEYTIRHVALYLVNPSTLEVLGKPYPPCRKEMYGQHPHLARNKIDRNKFGPGHCHPAGQPVLSNLHARGTKAHAMPQDKDTAGLQTKWYTICAGATPSFGIIFIVMKQRGVQIVFGSFPLPLMHKLLPNLTQRRLQVLACIYCISLRSFCWNSNMMPQNLLKQLH